MSTVINVYSLSCCSKVSVSSDCRVLPPCVCNVLQQGDIYQDMLATTPCNVTATVAITKTKKKLLQLMKGFSLRAPASQTKTSA